MFFSVESFLDLTRLLHFNFLCLCLVGRLIKLIQAWQGGFDDKQYVKFNTYTIAILVIFMLQRHRQLDQLQYIHIMRPTEDRSFQRLEDWLMKFFQLYGNEYQMHEQVIDVYHGVWLKLSNTQFQIR